MLINNQRSLLARPIMRTSLNKSESFPLRVSSVNVTKSAFSLDLATFTEEILNGKLHFLCSAWKSNMEIKINLPIA